jgi:uncharacterized surface protein with fasciclin (FAS1) repeats
VKNHALALAATAMLLTVGACNKQDNGSQPQPAQTPKAQKLAGTKTIAAGLAPAGRFMTVAKAAGLDQTLAGPGPYTVLVPDDESFGQAPAGPFDVSPKNRPQLTGVLTNLILPGTVLVADFDKLADQGPGKNLVATMGGGTLTVTKDGGKTVFTDAAGHKAAVTQGDEMYTNGVVHHIDAVLMPSKQTSPTLAVGQKAGTK